ncbi:low temperature requirement protein A [Affinirhizobium pseudoryzae]|uniref:low temperature requirement protein A n=1 Tax=Allorhizobium pseudoryzae TaxID=379684 RepID=UPI0013EC8281|nr:low temperature requirement protein A [Allorhizobium pseudoryzae]
MTKGVDSSRHWLRDEDQEDRQVGFPELFFDLVFVFSLIQLSHFIVEEFSLSRLVEGGVIALALWWVWNHTAWVTNWLDPARMPIRAMLFGLMFFGLLMSSAIPDAFGAKGLMFAGAYIAMQLGRSLFAIYAFRNVLPEVRRNFVRVSLWFGLSAVFWLWGALSGEAIRLTLWFIALAIEYAAPEVRFFVPGLDRSHASDWKISGEHMADRCALFVMICLGESILAIGRSFADEDLSWLVIATFVGAFLASVSMWWIYFHFGQVKTKREMEETDEPGELALHVFTYGHMPVVAGVILAAISAEHLLAHPGETGDAARALVILGGPVLFLAGNLFVKRVTTGRLPRSHLAGIGVALLFMPVGLSVATYWTGLVGLAALLLVAILEYRGLAQTPHASDEVGELESE